MSEKYRHDRQLGEIDWEVWQAVDYATLVFVVQYARLLLIRKKTGLGKGKINGDQRRSSPKIFFSNSNC